jgi:hypothetical protein
MPFLGEVDTPFDVVNVEVRRVKQPSPQSRLRLAALSIVPGNFDGVEDVP